MTLPNKITVIRIICAPLFYIVFSAASLIHEDAALRAAFFGCLFVFWLLLEATDVVDGYIARRYNMVSDMGKLLDPFSDVLSRLSYFICFVQAGFSPMWPLAVIFWRELSITFIRAVLAKGGITLAANSGGKLKAIFYFSASFFGMLLAQPGVKASLPDQHYRFLLILFQCCFILAALAAAVSFITYLRLFLKTDYVQKFLKEE